ncbi:hypothetical protein EV2_020237 [Malus domestica]
MGRTRTKHIWNALWRLGTCHRGMQGWRSWCMQEVLDLKWTRARRGVGLSLSPLLATLACFSSFIQPPWLV